MEERFERWGALTLLLASIPIVGQTAVVVAGVGKVNRATCVVILSISYLIRNWLIVLVAVGVIDAFSA